MGFKAFRFLGAGFAGLRAWVDLGCEVPRSGSGSFRGSGFTD